VVQLLEEGDGERVFLGGVAQLERGDVAVFVAKGC
jgi:hypothetical protein